MCAVSGAVEFSSRNALSLALPRVNAVRNLQELHSANTDDSNPSPQKGSAELFNIHALSQAMENINNNKKEIPADTLQRSSK